MTKESPTPTASANHRCLLRHGHFLSPFENYRKQTLWWKTPKRVPKRQWGGKIKTQIPPSLFSLTILKWPYPLIGFLLLFRDAKKPKFLFYLVDIHDELSQRNNKKSSFSSPHPPCNGPYYLTIKKNDVMLFTIMIVV